MTDLIPDTTIATTGPKVAPDDRRRLLRIARDAIAAVVGGAPELCVNEAELSEALRRPHGAFVTLTEGGELRGCMGRMDWERPLWENVIAAAISAAVEDPRFPVVSRTELPKIALEISVLDQPVDLPELALFEPTVHGIVVARGFRRAVLLPQVARERGWGAEQTLATVCVKAGLPADAWRDPDTTLMVFTSSSFAEDD